MSLVSWVADLRFEFVFGGIRFKSNDHKQTVDLYLDILNQIQAINKNACHFGFRFPSLVRSFFKAHWFPLPTRSCFLSRFLSMQKSSLNHPKKKLSLGFFWRWLCHFLFFPCIFAILGVTAASFEGKTPIPAGLLSTRAKWQITAARSCIFGPPGCSKPPSLLEKMASSLPRATKSFPTWIFCSKKSRPKDSGPP